ncbi:MAG: hypothetical protein GX987_03105 [Tissierellia bacterium]|nr:hypothetical protein [Tissierellia bacterium]
MIKERLKTFLLLSLVCISIFLTRRLWLDMPYDILPFFEKEEAISSSYLFGDMIKPHKYLLNFDKKSHTIFYNDDNNNLWTSTRSTLVEVLSSDNFETHILSNEEFSTYNERRSIVFYFPEKFNTYIIARSLGVAEPNNIIERMPKIDRVYLYLGREDPFFVFSEGHKHLKVYDINVDTKIVKEQIKKIEEGKEYTYYYAMKDTIGGDNNIFIPYEMAKTLPLIYVENELDVYDIEQIRSISEKFFNKDIDYIREIIEDSGSIIYVYNQRVLKINQNGLLEYFNPLEEHIEERNLYISLNTTAEFLSNHIGVPKDMYLAKVEEIKAEENLGYRLTFRYRVGGIPVILGNDTIEDFIQVDVFNKYVRNYKRFIRKDMNIDTDAYNKVDDNRMLSAFDIINMNYNLLEEEYMQGKDIFMEDIDREMLMEEILSSIKNITIAYLDPCLKEKEEKLIGVWLLQIEDRIYAFDVYNGELVLKRKQ